MTFAQPWFLFGLFALAVPVIVHLFNFRKPKTIYFTKVKLLKQSVIEINKTQKVKHYLVLVSRLLFLLFLILAFAQPQLNTQEKAKAGVIGIYVDNSQSMLATSENGDVLTSSINMVDALANNLGRNTKFVFLDNDFSSADLRIINREQLKDRLTEVAVSPKTRSLVQSQKKLYGNIERLGFGQQGHMYLVSDCQKSVNKNSEPLLPQNTRLVNLSTKGKFNVYIDTVYLENPYVMPEENTTLKVVLSCSGDESVDQVPVSLVMDEIGSGTANVKLAPGQSTVIEFNVKIKADKAALCKIHVEDSPVVFDNDYYFVLQPIKPIHVTVVSDQAQNYAAKVFEGDPSFVLEKYSFSSINYGKLKQAQLLVIDGVENADQVLLEYANDILKKNGSVIFNVSKSYVNSNVSASLSRLAGQPLSVVNDTSGLAFESVQMPDANNPFFRNIYKSTKDNVQLPKAKIVLNVRSREIYRTSQGKQVVSQYPVAKGSLFSINTVLDGKYADFQTHPFYVTFMLKVALSSNNAEEPLAYSVNTQTLMLSNSEIKGSSNFKLKSKEMEVVPAVYPQNAEIMLDLSGSALKTGFYSIIHNEVVLKTIALNYTKAESQLESYDNDQLRALFGTNKKINVIDANAINEVVKEIKGDFDNNYLWKYCLVLALLFLAMEVLLLRILK